MRIDSWWRWLAAVPLLVCVAASAACAGQDREIQVRVVVRNEAGEPLADVPVCLDAGRGEQWGLTAPDGVLAQTVIAPVDAVTGRELVVLFSEGTFATATDHGPWPSMEVARKAVDSAFVLRRKYALPNWVVVPIAANQTEYEVVVTARPNAKLALKAAMKKDEDGGARQALVVVDGVWGYNVVDLELGGMVTVRRSFPCTLFVTSNGTPRVGVLELPADATVPPTSASVFDEPLPVTIDLPPAPKECRVNLTLTNRDAPVGAADRCAALSVTLVRSDGAYVFRCNIGSAGTLIASFDHRTQTATPLNLDVPSGKYYVCPDAPFTPLAVKMVKMIRAGGAATLDQNQVPSFQATLNGNVTVSVDLAQALSAVRAAVGWP